MHEISALGTLQNLEVLDVSACPEIDDIGCLGGCTSLLRLDVSYTSVTRLVDMLRLDEAGRMQSVMRAHKM